MLRIRVRSQWACKGVDTGLTRRAIPMLVSGLALMAGLLASTGAQAQCTGDNGGIGIVGSGLTAVTSMIGTVNTAFMTPGSAFVASPESAPNQIGGGVWVRTVGGTADTYSNTNFTGVFDKFDVSGQSNSQPNISCRTKIGQDFAGFQAGHDIAFLNQGANGQNWHVGVMAGYIGAKFKDETPAGSIAEPLGGAMKGNYEVPYAGLYATFSKDHFFADVQARADYYQGDFSGLRLDARGYSLTGNMGYNLAFGDGWSLEPSVGGVYSRTSVDQTQAAGFMASQSMNNGSGWTNVPGMGAMQMQDVESLLGRASIKLSKTVALDGGQIIAAPFATASLMHEFAGDVKASVSAMGGTYDFTDLQNPTRGFWQGSGTLTASRIGTYAQFGLGSSFMFANTGWLGFARVDYRSGDNIESISGTAGLRYQLNPDAGGLKEGASSLKDASPAAHSWTGPYLGVSAGGVAGNTPWTDADVGSLNPDFGGYLAGVQAGYNYQTGRFVLGAEGSYGRSNARGASHTFVDTTNFMDTYSSTSFEDELKSLGSVTGRLGYTFGPALLYAKGGWAFGQVKEGQRAIPYPGVSRVETVDYQPTTKWAYGWTAGGGMEFALTDSWSAKAEYMHYELGKQSFDLGSVPTGFGGATSPVDAKTKGDSVQVGINYHLGRGGSGDTYAGASDAPLK
jgi:opacity protein-like surface antigen